LSGKRKKERKSMQLEKRKEREEKQRNELEKKQRREKRDLNKQQAKEKVRSGPETRGGRLHKMMELSMDLIPLMMKTLPFVQNVVVCIPMMEVIGFVAIVVRTGTISNVLVLRVKEMFLNYSAVKNAKTRLCLII
jgi:hypothetical protein